jgi:hypothetical protein
MVLKEHNDLELLRALVPVNDEEVAILLSVAEARETSFQREMNHG